MDDILENLQKEYCPPLDPATFLAIAGDFDLFSNDGLLRARETLDTLKLFALEEEQTSFDPSGSSGAAYMNGKNVSNVDSSEQDGSVPEKAWPSRDTDLTSLTQSQSQSSWGVEELSECEARNNNDNKSKGALKGKPKKSNKSSSSCSFTSFSSSSWATAAVADDSSQTLSHEAKLCELQQMFPDVGDFTIEHTLKKVDDNIERAMDILLNLVFLDNDEDDQSDDGEEGENGVKAKGKGKGKGTRKGKISSIPKGIDGFDEENGYLLRSGGAKSKSKRKSKVIQRQQEEMSQAGVNVSNSPTSSSWRFPTTAPTSVPAWSKERKEIEFLASRTGLSIDAASRIYVDNGSTLSSAVEAILEENTKTTVPTCASTSMSTTDPDLSIEFPTIPSSYISALLRLAAPSTAHAHELARALITNKIPSSNGSGSASSSNAGGSSGGVEIIFKRPQLPTSTNTLPLRSNRRSSGANTGTDDDGDEGGGWQVYGGTGKSYATATELAASHSEAATATFAQASAYYRRSKSNHLMSGAAAYYSSEGRRHAQLASTLRSSAADALVSTQTRHNELDLHGIGVADGVRIALETVHGWWTGLGERRLCGSRDGGVQFRIVTGRGSHSIDGRARLGPAVGRALLHDGWRVEIESGAVVVRGRARSRK